MNAAQEQRDWKVGVESVLNRYSARDKFWRTPRGRALQEKINFKRLRKFREDTKKNYWLYRYDSQPIASITERNKAMENRIRVEEVFGI